MMKPNLFLVCLLAFASLFGFAHAYTNSTDYGMDLIYTSGGAVINAVSADYRTDSVVGIINQYMSSANYSSHVGLFVFNASSTALTNTSINVSILYPPNNSVFGPQCWSIVQVAIVENSGAPIAGSCSLYLNNGTAYNLYASLPFTGNATLNFSVNTSGMYRVNCTATVNGNTAYSPTFDEQIIGTGICTAAADDQGAYIWLIIVGITLMLGVYGIIQWPGVAFAVIMEILGITASGAIAATNAGQGQAEVVFAWFFNLAAVGAVLACLWFIYELLRQALAGFKHRGL